VKFNHIKESNHRIFIAMEFAKGGTLADIIKEKKLKENDCKKIIEKLL
jgi:serine/threonine protein kinase